MGKGIDRGWKMMDVTSVGTSVWLHDYHLCNRQIKIYSTLVFLFFGGGRWLGVVGVKGGGGEEGGACVSRQ